MYIGQQKSFLKKLGITKFILNLENSYYYSKHLERRFINILSFDIGFLDLKA